MKNTSKNYLKVAEAAARKAGQILMASYGHLKASQIRMKALNDFVTDVDKRSERSIVSTVRRHFPDHSIQGEEGGLDLRDGSVRWIIDPLDGTSNYIHGFPMFAVSIGVLEGDRYAAAVVFDPVHRELFTAQAGGGAFLNGKPIRVSNTARLADSFMATGIPFRARKRFGQYIRTLNDISLATAGMRRGGSAALDLAYVACGRFDGFWEINLSPWDIAASALLIQEAGGAITDVWGRGHYLKSGDVLASNGRIQSDLKAITSRIFTAAPAGPRDK